MDNIVTFFKLLFFLKTTLITATPVNIGNEWISIVPNEALEAITGGAALHIDVTKHIEPLEFDAANKAFPKGSVHAKLILRNGNELLLTNTGNSFGKDTAMLIVACESLIPADTEFIEVRIKSSVPIESAMIYWKNGKH